MEDYLELLKSRLSEKRYIHSLCVAKKAKELAVKYGADADKAYTAGLLHDICKDMPNEKLLQLINQFGIILSAIEKKEPKLLHAIAGYGFIKNVLNINDDDMLNAVRFHTTARAGMSVLEKVLYLADFVSDDRDYNGVENMRAAVNKSMGFAMLEALKFTISDLCEREHAVHTDTINAYNEIICLG